MERSLQFAVTHVVPAPNEDVWRVLGDFGHEHRWTKRLSRCIRNTSVVGVGTVRTCRLPRPLMGRTEVREVLTHFEPGHSFAYVLEGSTGPFSVASSRWSTSPAHDDATAVTVEGLFTPKNAAVPVVVWPFVKPLLQRLTKRILRELAAFLQSR
jgi:hypothetical protein